MSRPVHAPGLPELPGLAVPVTQRNRLPIFQCLKIGLDLYLNHNVRMQVSERTKFRLPSRDTVISEAKLRGHGDTITAHIFNHLWSTRHHYQGDLAVFACAQNWQHRLLSNTRYRLTEEAMQLTEKKLSLSDLILQGALSDMRIRVRMVATTRQIQGIPVGPTYRKAAQRQILNGQLGPL